VKGESAFSPLIDLAYDMENHPKKNLAQLLFVDQPFSQKDRPKGVRLSLSPLLLTRVELLLPSQRKREVLSADEAAPNENLAEAFQTRG
jgi:hypothetical protein